MTRRSVRRADIGSDADDSPRLEHRSIENIPSVQKFL